jgi:transaldolase
MTSRLQQIGQFGQRIWLDNISRDIIASGELQKLIQNDGITGVTSNPTIFQKAISSSKKYQNDLQKVKQSKLPLEQRYESLVIPDIQAACDIFNSVYLSSNNEDGYVSLEVSPHLANNALETVNNGIRLWHEVNRPNLMIKVPATKSGITALEELIYKGVNVNITLLFSLEQVVDTWHAYIRGLKRRIKENLEINHIKGVASFFLSRIDSTVDEKLPVELQGKTAINVAKLAYLVYQEIFSSKEFVELEKLGAKKQFLLFASTGTKNPKYSDVLYVDELIGNETINTIPDSTLAAFRDHGNASDTLPKNILDASSIIDKVQKYVNLQMIAEKLQQDGLAAFINSFDALIELVKD